MGKRKSPNELTSAESVEDWKHKYEQATKLLGEKELEIALLRELVKKNMPEKQWSWPENGSAKATKRGRSSGSAT